MNNTVYHMIDELFLNNLYTDLFGKTPLVIEPIVNLGYVNKVFKIILRDDIHVIKLREEAKAYDEYLKEKYCAEQAESVGIFTSAVILVDVYNKVPFMIQKYIDGINGSLCPDKSELVWKSLGRYARLLHTVDVRGFGLEMIERGNFNNSFNPTLNNHIEYNINEICINDMFLKMGIYPVEKIAAIKIAFLSLLDNDFEIKLIHGDLSVKNTVIKGGKVYLIDFGCAHAGVVPFDTYLSLDGNTEDEFKIFREAYGISNEEYMSDEPIYRVFVMLNAFDKLRWAIDNKNNEIDYYANQAKIGYENFKKYS